MAGNTAKFPLSIVVAAVDKATGPIRRIQSMIDRTFGPLQKLRGHLRMRFAETGISKLGLAFRGLGSHIVHVASTTGGLITKLGLLTGAAGAATFAVVRGFAKSGDEISKASHRLGISTDKLQAWRYAADANGVAAGTLESALHTLKDRLRHAAFGFGEARVAVTRLNLDLRDSEGNLRSVESLLPEIADKLGAWEDVTQRNAIVTKLFGGAGIEMTQILAVGAKGLAELEARFAELGGGISKEGIEKSKGFIGVLADLRESFLSLRNIIGESMIPVMADFFGRMTDWISENRERIRAFVEGFMEKLPGRIATLRAKLAQFWASMQPVIEKLREWADWLSKNDRWIAIVAGAVAGLAGILAKPLVLALGLAAKAVIGLGLAILTTPVGWILGGIALLVGAIVWLGDHWDWLGEKVDQVVGWIVEQLGKLYEMTVGALEGVGGFIKGALGFEGSVEVAAAGAGGDGGERLIGAGESFVPPPIEYQDPGELRVVFDNLPAGASVDSSKMGKRAKLDVGYALPEQGGSF